MTAVNTPPSVKRWRQARRVTLAVLTVGVTAAVLDACVQWLASLVV